MARLAQPSRLSRLARRPDELVGILLGNNDLTKVVHSSELNATEKSWHIKTNKGEREGSSDTVIGVSIAEISKREDNKRGSKHLRSS